MERQKPRIDKDMKRVEFRPRSCRGSLRHSTFLPGARMTDCMHWVFVGEGE